MDGYELKAEKKAKRKSPLWNILTVLVLLALCGVSAFFVNVFANPYTPLNPFPPAMLPTKYVTNTPTNTVRPLEPTWTPTPTTQPSPSRTKAPTWTPLVIDTPVPSVTFSFPTEAGSVTPTIQAGAAADVTYVASTTAHSDLGCKWMGVGGKVLDASGKPLPFQVVQLGGTLNNKPISLMLLSGHDPQQPYGASGFEFALGTTPIASTQELWIMLSDNVGKPLSDKIYFDTHTACDKNLVMVVFTVTK